jgi:hypothetical protein
LSAQDVLEDEEAVLVVLARLLARDGTERPAMVDPGEPRVEPVR